MSDDEFKAFFRNTDPGIQFDETEPEPVQKEEIVKILEGKELDSLVGEIGIERKSGESDIDLRERAALKALETDTEKCLEVLLAKRKGDWHPDEKMLFEAFTKAEENKKEAFIRDYLHREEVSPENKKLAIQHNVLFPQVCILDNDLREVMSWFLGTVAPWDRDPCLGCSHCLLGKNPQHVPIEDCQIETETDE